MNLNKIITLNNFLVIVRYVCLFLYKPRLLHCHSCDYTHISSCMSSFTHRKHLECFGLQKFVIHNTVQNFYDSELMSIMYIK